ncbi:MAG: ATP-dependent protease [Gammaproteobacteria bacterium]|nr:MAG: ATP-dependent protease [Gammaproteobacteria bacterium]
MVETTQLSSKQLYQHCDTHSLKFDSTAELDLLPTIIGQSRALESIDFGVNITGNGYNLFVMGAAGSGKYTLVKRYLDEHKNQSKANDWAYLNNFSESGKPSVISLEAGQGKQLHHDIEKVIKQLSKDLPHVFDDEYYRGRMRSIDEESRKHRVRLFGILQKEADRQGIILLRMQDNSYAFAAKRDGEAMTADDFEQLPVDEQEKTEHAIATLHEDLQHTLLELGEWERDNKAKVTALNEEVATEVISGQVTILKNAYPKNKQLQSYFNAMKKDLINNVSSFLPADLNAEDIISNVDDNAVLRRYQINLIVDNHDIDGAPIIYENLPSHQSLLGCVENMAMMGALITDFSLIKAGALHRANGGYLILDVEQLLMQPYAWEGLKRALQAKEVRFDAVEQMYNLAATVSLEPEPVPLDLKVILLGDRELYYQLYEHDPEFAELFKVAADFEEKMQRTTENDALYARLIASTVQSEGLLHLERDAVAKVIEEAARSIEESQEFSLHLGRMTDLLRESNYWAVKREVKQIARQDVIQTLNSREQRNDRVKHSLYDDIRRGITLIDVSSEQVGQVNALSVLSVGELSFGQPSRLTARCRFGDGDIVDIEREVELGGDLHSKGMLIMSGYLGSEYAKNKPLSMSASLVFEQNYGEVDGDSATAAELCALLSAIAELPLNQSLAITGSMNQSGEIQAIGGVNEKIEGFYDVCKLVGMTGKQGVIIPKSNIQHLMLKQDIIDAVETKQFYIHAVDNIEQALQLLSGIEIGRKDDNGDYPTGSFNAAVAARLQQWIDVNKHEKESDSDESDS